MMRSLYSGVSGLKNHQTRMDVIGNNIANVNTAGFKASRVVFQDVYSQMSKAASAANGTSVGGTNARQIGLGVNLAAIDLIHSSAATQRTDGELDLAIEGDGFFMVKAADGQYMYTRAGNLYVDESGNLVTTTGMMVQGLQAVTYVVQKGTPEKPAVLDPVDGSVITPAEPAVPAKVMYVSGATDYTDPANLLGPDHSTFDDGSGNFDTSKYEIVTGVLPAWFNLRDGVTDETSVERTNAVKSGIMNTNNFSNLNLRGFTGISIDDNGIITGLDENSEKRVIAVITIATFTNNGGLEKKGNSLYVKSSNSGEPTFNQANAGGAGKINPGGLEMSNVDLANEFTDMIVTQRGFQANSRIITVSDTMLEELINLKR